MSNSTKGNVTKKGRSAKEVVAIMKAGAKAERERREATKVEAKSEVFQVRLEPSLVQYIESAAQEQGIRSSAFVRNLIAEKRDQKPAPQTEPQSEVSEEQAHMIWEVNHKLGILIGAFNNMNEKVIKLETAFKNVGIVGIKGPAEEPGRGIAGYSPMHGTSVGGFHGPISALLTKRESENRIIWSRTLAPSGGGGAIVKHFVDDNVDFIIQKAFLGDE